MVCLTSNSPKRRELPRQTSVTREGLTCSDAFGKVTGDSAATIEALFKFTARPYDEDVELQNNLNRWYDLSTGRWVSTDPLRFLAGDSNLYRYVGTQPTYYADALGLASHTAVMFADVWWHYINSEREVVAWRDQDSPNWFGGERTVAKLARDEAWRLFHAVRFKCGDLGGTSDIYDVVKVSPDEQAMLFHSSSQQNSFSYFNNPQGQSGWQAVLNVTSHTMADGVFTMPRHLITEINMSGTGPESQTAAIVSVSGTVKSTLERFENPFRTEGYEIVGAGIGVGGPGGTSWGIGGGGGELDVSLGWISVKLARQEGAPMFGKDSTLELKYAGAYKIYCTCDEPGETDFVIERVHTEPEAGVWTSTGGQKPDGLGSYFEKAKLSP